MLVVWFLAPSAASAQAPAPQTRPAPVKPAAAMPWADCTKGGCHASVKDHKVIHGPVNVDACDACHKVTDAAQHTFTLTRDKKQICTFCHQLDLSKAKVVHKPVRDGDCLQCHEPHGGFNKQFIRGKTMRDACAACHKDVIGNKTHVHGPVAAGACDACHRPHTSDKPKLLVAVGRDLCVTCHKEMDTQLAKAKFKHKAVEQGCESCHDPHASNFPMQIKAAPADLCTKCHQKQKLAATEAPFKHSVVLKGQACINCHTPHGGNLEHLVRREPIKICLSCHDKPIVVSKDKTIVSMADVLNPKLDRHGPIRDGQCSGCHEPHGSANDHLLAKPFPAGFYQSFELDKYALCFTCHDKQLVLTEKTDTLTKFRNGDRSLHFVHVNRDDKGRSCIACHEMHVSKYPLHLRESVPFGQWNMPINFNATPTGGSCAPGCHKKLSYDRVNPVAPPEPSGPAPATP